MMSRSRADATVSDISLAISAEVNRGQYSNNRREMRSSCTDRPAMTGTCKTPTLVKYYGKRLQLYDDVEFRVVIWPVGALSQVGQVLKDAGLFASIAHRRLMSDVADNMTLAYKC